MKDQREVAARDLDIAGREQRSQRPDIDTRDAAPRPIRESSSIDGCARRGAARRCSSARRHGGGPADIYGAAGRTQRRTTFHDGHGPAVSSHPIGERAARYSRPRNQDCATGHRKIPARIGPYPNYLVQHKFWRRIKMAAFAGAGVFFANIDGGLCPFGLGRVNDVMNSRRLMSTPLSRGSHPTTSW